MKYPPSLRWLFIWTVACSFAVAFLPLQAQTALTWDGGGGTNVNWTTATNWSPDGNPSGADISFATAGKTARNTVGNIVDANLTINSLFYNNSGTNAADWLVTSISAGETLTINPSVLPTSGNVLQVGIDSSSSSVRVTRSAIEGGGTLTIQSPAGNIWINNTTQNSTSSGYAELDMSGLAAFNASINKFLVGVSVVGGAGLRGSGIVYLAEENTITGSVLGVGSSEGLVATKTVSEFHLGRVNTLNFDNIYIGASVTSGTQNRLSGIMDFQSYSGGETPSVVIRASDGISRVSNFNIGVTDAFRSDVNTSYADFTGGTVDALISNLLIGQAWSTDNVSLSMSSGIIDATNVTLGVARANASGSTPVLATATINVSGGTFRAGNLLMAAHTSGSSGGISSVLNISGTGVVEVVGNITLGDSTSSAPVAQMAPTINITGGMLTVRGNVAEGTNPGRITSTINLNGGTFDMDGGTITNLNTFNVQSGTLRNLAQFNAGANITKTTSGTLIIDGTNAYTGDTLVNEGTVRVNGSTTASTNDFTVANAATLGGAGGSIAGTVTIQAGGTLDPGASASSTGLLTTGSLALQSSSAVKMQINGATAGAGYDQVTINGSVNLGSAADLQLTLGYGALTIGQTFAILLNDGTDAITGAFATINGAAFGADNTFDLAYNSATYSFKLYYTGNGTSTTGGNDAVLEVTAVPEPSTIALLLSALLSVVMIARRRRQFAQEKI